MNKAQVKEHFQRNKKLYIGIGIGVVIGAAGAVLLVANKVSQSGGTNIIIGKDNEINNNLIQMVNLARRGHPGNVILCDQTGEVFASQARAAAACDISPASLSEHLRGAKKSVKGLTFTNLGEATAA